MNVSKFISAVLFIVCFLSVPSFATKSLQCSSVVGRGATSWTNRLPKKVNVIEIPLERFELETSRLKIANTFSASEDQFYQLPWKYLDRLKNAIQRKFKKKVTKIFYPMGGADGATAFRLFPEAKTVLMVENNPIIERTEIENVSEKMLYSHQPYVAWTSYRDLMRDLVISSILGKLTAAVPNFRLRSVHILESQEWQWQSEKIKRLPSTHGVVTFDQGPGTPLRQYVHIDAYLRKNDKVTNQWWIEAFGMEVVDAIILKASMGILNPSKDFVDLRRDIEQWGMDSNALLVEGHMKGGTGPESYKKGWEFSGSNPQQTDEIILENFYWSYSGTVRVSQFDH